MMHLLLLRRSGGAHREGRQSAGGVRIRPARQTRERARLLEGIPVDAVLERGETVGRLRAMLLLLLERREQLR